MQWNSFFLKNITNALSQLPHSTLNSVLRELRLVELCGTNIKLPHVRSIGKKVYQIRDRFNGIYIFYTLPKPDLLVVLKIFELVRDKTDIFHVCDSASRLTRYFEQSELQNLNEFRKKKLSKDELKQSDDLANREFLLLQKYQQVLTDTITSTIEKKRMNFDDAIEQTGVSPTQLHKIYRGSVDLTIAQLAQLETYLNINFGIIH